MTWGDPRADDAAHLADYRAAEERKRAEPRLAAIEDRLAALEQAVAARSSMAGRPDPVADRLEGLLKIVRSISKPGASPMVWGRLDAIEAELVAILGMLGRDVI